MQHRWIRQLSGWIGLTLCPATFAAAARELGPGETDSCIQALCVLRPGFHVCPAAGEEYSLADGQRRRSWQCMNAQGVITLEPWQRITSTSPAWCRQNAGALLRKAPPMTREQCEALGGHPFAGAKARRSPVHPATGENCVSRSGTEGSAKGRYEKVFFKNVCPTTFIYRVQAADGKWFSTGIGAGTLERPTLSFIICESWRRCGEGPWSYR